MARVSNLKGAGPGRPKGCPNRVTLELKEMIEKALMKAGGIRYLEEQAKANPGAFLTLVAKLLPRDLHVSGSVGSLNWWRPLKLGERGFLLRGQQQR